MVVLEGFHGFQQVLAGLSELAGLWCVSAGLGVSWHVSANLGGSLRVSPGNRGFDGS